MRKVLYFTYGVLSYGTFLVAFLYAIGFVGNLVVPKSIDSPAGPFSVQSLLVDSLLLGLFAIQHSVMARPAFKQVWTKIVPHAIERSTYVLLASLILLLLFWQWRAMTDTIWDVNNAIARSVLVALFGVGWLTVLLSTFMINHFDLFGLRQVYLNLRNQASPHAEFKTSWLYKIIRHPLMLGFLTAFWSTPTMTAGHLLFAVMTTGYILVAIQLEERDLAAMFGDTYRRYRQQVPMLIPIPKHPPSDLVVGQAHEQNS